MNTLSLPSIGIKSSGKDLAHLFGDRKKFDSTVKFVFSKKATKNDKIFTVDLTLTIK